MALETELKKLTDAVVELTEIIKKNVGIAGETDLEEVTPKKAAKPEAKVPAKTAAKKAKDDVEDAEDFDSDEDESEDEEEGISEDELKAYAKKFHKNEPAKRDKCKAAIKKLTGGKGTTIATLSPAQREKLKGMIADWLGDSADEEDED